MAATAFPLEEDKGEDDMIVLPRREITFPLAFGPPAGFLPADLATWPKVEGRLEYVNGRLEFTPPCGEAQQVVAFDIGVDIGIWCRANPGFSAGGNEAGMKLEGDVRAADVGVWRKTEEPAGSGFRRTPPILAVEVIGKDDTLALLREKAAWYLAHGVETVWIVDPKEREAHVVTASGSVTVKDRMPEPASLPGLTPELASFFRQL